MSDMGNNSHRINWRYAVPKILSEQYCKRTLPKTVYNSNEQDNHQDTG